VAFENPIGPEDREQWLRDKIELRKRQISDLKACPQSVAEEATALGQELAALSRSIQVHAVPSHLEPALISMRQMLGLAAACHKLRDELSAEAYLCHDDMPLLASHLLAAAHAGDLLWDVPEIPDRYGRFGRNDQSWPRSALEPGPKLG
jgi:hypothetical protein